MMVQVVLINVGVHQGCMVSPWLCNGFMDGALSEMRIRWSDNSVLRNHSEI